MKTSDRVRVRLARDAAEVEAAYDLAARVFGGNLASEARAQKAAILHELEPVDGPADVVLATQAGMIVGLIRLVSRRLRFGPDIFTVAGITSVAVDPACRARGIGARLMRFAMQEGRRRGADLSLLFARRAVDGWYPRFGFVGAGQHVHCQVPGPLPVRPAPGRGRLTCVDGFDAGRSAGYRSAYASAYRRVPGSFVRSADWWQRLPVRLRLRPTLTFVTLAVAGRRTAGYAVLEADRILEVGISPAAAAAAAATLVEATRQRGHHTPAFTMHPSHPVMQAIAAANHTLSIRRAWDGGHMTAPLTPAAAARLRAHGLWSSRAADVRAWPAWTALDEF